MRGGKRRIHRRKGTGLYQYFAQHQCMEMMEDQDVGEGRHVLETCADVTACILCVYMYICMYIYSIYTHVFIHMHIRTYICLCTYTCICTHTRTLVCICLCVCIYVYAQVYKKISIYIYMYVYIYIYSVHVLVHIMSSGLKETIPLERMAFKRLMGVWAGVMTLLYEFITRFGGLSKE